jgi:hypothetical protein
VKLTTNSAPSFPAKERVKDSLRGFESLGNELPAGPIKIAASPAQGICLKPLRQLHKAAFQSLIAVALQKKTLQNSLRAGNAPSCAV